ncbi:MAG TPA: class I SAM-dependent methyltransferase [Ideonella sp.]|jgi:SAM-dependent methyltransferase|nr:class I SAM-dependent methyltransferase [Ideonella sp.]
MDLKQQDRINQAWYTHPGAVAGMVQRQGFIDEGERAAFWRLADEMRGQPILDIGIGPGRTVTLLRALSADYVGIDYLPAMVELAGQRHPQAEIRVGDARDLGAFADGQFALITFSDHGIDSVGHADRARVLAEACRVLRPGGVFWFSTLNLDGPAARYSPWRPMLPRAPARRWHPLGWLRFAIEWLGAWAHVPFSVSRYRRSLAMAERGEGWAIAPFFPGDWRLVTHYTTLAHLRQALTQAGFDQPVELYEDAAGARVEAATDLRAVFGFNVLARKPGAVPTAPA